jgi:prepilin-type N-terminal cleavage/methylation domain-containing protein/prepilin-type processing-associated H-X9-DG protein
MRKRGFTLIELLVVIAIIALLMAILTPTLQRVRRQGKAVACQSNLHQWALMFSMYTGDNNGRFFGHSHGMLYLDREYWLTALQPYWRESNDVLLCPMAMKLADPRHWPDPSWSTNIWVPGSKFSAWGYGYRDEGLLILGSYGLNRQIHNQPDQAGLPPFWRTCLVHGADKVPVLLDCIWACAGARDLDEPPEYDDLALPMNISRFCINRHDGYVNSLFMDWSVRKVGLKELWTLKWHREFNTAGPWTKAGGVQPEDWPQWMRRFKDY